MFYNEPLEISAETWANLLRDKEVTTEFDLNILKLMYGGKNHEMRASEIASKLNIPHHGVINLQVSRFGKRVVAKTGVQPSLRRDGKPRWWHVPFLGYEKGGKFPWIMRPELVTAFEKVFGKDDYELTYSGEATIEDVPTLAEGTVSQVFVNRYERNRRARSMSIAYHGSQCAVCGFDFEKVYGSIGKDKIHVHHLIPVLIYLFIQILKEDPHRLNLSLACNLKCSLFYLSEGNLFKITNTVHDGSHHPF